jgi:hypothetical protein
MRGRPLRDAQAAACALVDHLDDHDEVGLLCFHRLVDEMVYPARLTPDVRSFLKEQILAVTTGRGTNIGEACRVGLRLLGEPEGVGRLVLLSDGEPSVGILSREELVERFSALRPHCTVSAVGLGDHSDPWLMRALAIAGRGAYAFVPESTSPHLALGAALAGCRACRPTTSSCASGWLPTCASGRSSTGVPPAASTATASCTSSPSAPTTRCTSPSRWSSPPTCSRTRAGWRWSDATSPRARPCGCDTRC